ncbi:MAG: Gfo/Idh/MocA family oxidoreductase [Planctomycetes bacterium]|nr:Gfo/Idh/MocA family oxidoreductase [Planctomycetota bacterium]
MSDPVRAAVIGVGAFGRHHARILSEMPEARLVGVVDANPEVRAKATEQWKVPAYADPSELPADVEAVSVAVPTALHHRVALPFLERGVSVLVEKPMVRNLDEGRELIAAAERSGAILQVGHVERFNPAVRALAQHKIRPRFIEAERVAPFSFRSADVGVVLDLMIHDIDIVLHLAGTEPVRVEAIGVPVLTAHEDIANARVVFADGCVANLTSSRVATKTERKLRVFSSESYLVVDFGKREGWLYRKSPELTLDKVKAFASGATSLADLQGVVFRDLLSMEKLETPPGDPLTEEIRDFLRCVREKDRPRVGGREGLAAVSLALRILEAIRTGSPPQ